MDTELKNKLKDTLNSKLPEFQRDPDLPIAQYVDSGGEMLDELRTTIHAMGGYLNWYDCPIDRINSLGQSYGFDFPRNLGEETRRTIVRDITNIYKRNGTEDSFRWIFKLIGWDVEVEYAWLLNPDLAMQGKKTIIHDGSYNYGDDINYDDLEDLDLENFNYRDFLYGEARVDDDGVFFYGKKYFQQIETFKKVPIKGEYYKNRRIDPLDPVIASTPYVVVRIREQDYRLFTEPYTDPDTGIEYSYTDGERFEIAEELINFLLYDQGRPVNVRVVVIVTDERIQDEMPEVEDDLTQEFFGWLDEFDDGVEDIQEAETADYPIGIVRIGDTQHKIGKWTNPYTNVSFLTGLEVKPTAQIINPYVDNQETTIPLYFEVGATGLSREYTIRHGTVVSFTVPSGITIDIYGKQSILDNNETPTLIQSNGGGSTVSLTLDNYHMIYFDITGTIPTQVTGEIKYTQLTN